MRKHSKKLTAVIAGTAAAVAVSGVAYAYWTTTGTADGTVAAQAGLSGFTVAQTAVSGTPLYPGATQALAGTVKNKDTTSPAQLQTIVATIKDPTGTNVAGSTGHPACTTADYILVAASGSGWTLNSAKSVATLHPNTELAKVGTGDTYSFSGLSVQMVDRGDTVAGDGLGNQDSCKGATFNITYDAS